MKKQFLLSILLFLYSLSIIAQTKENTLSFREKKQINKALKTEVYTLDGQYHNGYLYYSDSEKIYLTKNPLLNDSLTVIRAEDIYQFKVVSQVPFFKRFGSGMIFSASVMALITAETYSHGDAIMIGPDFVIVAGTTFFGTPFSLLTALIFPKERTDFEYRTEGDTDAFKITSDFMEKRRISSVHPSMENIKVLSITKDDKELKNIMEPLEALHPDATRSIDFKLGTSVSLINSGKQLGKIFDNAPSLATTYFSSDCVSFTSEMQVNVSRNIRPYLSFSYGETGYGSGTHLPEQDEPEYIYVDYSIFYGTLGADYVLNPQTNIAESPFEFSVGGGLSFVKLQYGYYTNSYDFFSQKIEKSYTGFGLQMGARADYYFSRILSINFALKAELMAPINLDDMRFESNTSGSLLIDGGQFNTTNIHSTLGVGIHL